MNPLLLQMSSIVIFYKAAKNERLRLIKTILQKFLRMKITGSKFFRLYGLAYSFLIRSERSRSLEHTNIALGMLGKD